MWEASPEAVPAPRGRLHAVTLVLQSSVSPACTSLTCEQFQPCGPWQPLWALRMVVCINLGCGAL